MGLTHTIQMENLRKLEALEKTAIVFLYLFFKKQEDSALYWGYSVLLEHS